MRSALWLSCSVLTVSPGLMPASSFRYSGFTLLSFAKSTAATRELMPWSDVIWLRQTRYCAGETA
jgi:hypothetical protein